MDTQKNLKTQSSHFSARKGLRWRILCIVLLALVTSLYVYPNVWNFSIDALDGATAKVSWLSWVKIPQLPVIKFHLGLDLQGGAHLVYKADTKDIPLGQEDQALEGVRDVIERRVNAFGVAEPVVQATKVGGERHVIVELAGIKDVGQAIKMIGETPVLEFKEEAVVTPRALTDEEKKDMAAFNDTAKTRAQDVTKELKAQSEIDFGALAKKYSDDTTTKETDGALGFVSETGAYSELWWWANRNGAGKISLDPIENAEGFNIIKVGSEKNAGKEVEANHLLICYKGADRCDSETTKEDALKKVKELKAQATPANFEQLTKENSTEPGVADGAGYLGWFGTGAMVKPFEDVAFPMTNGTISDVIETQFGYHLIFKKGERDRKEYEMNRILIKKKTDSDYLPAPDPWKFSGLTGKQLSRATLDFDQTSFAPQVSLEFNDEGKILFADITKRSTGKLVAIFLDGEPISVPRVNEPILDGKAVITGNFTVVEAKILVQRLNAGALPVPITLVSQQTIGPSLGKESLDSSLKAGYLGFLIVAVFMLLYYRLPGLIAIFALLLYTTINLALYKFMPVTLSLSGIAGFILSVGMAVDANVLIFERMKEELLRGKALGTAIDEGFKRAWNSIRDSNFTTLISCAILFYTSSSLIKGFALTLALGVLVSMFSAITVSRTLLRLAASRGWLKNPNLYLPGFKTIPATVEEKK